LKLQGTQVEEEIPSLEKLIDLAPGKEGHKARIAGFLISTTSFISLTSFGRSSTHYSISFPFSEYTNTPITRRP